MADQRPSSFIEMIRSDEELPHYGGTKYQGSVPDPKTLPCVRSRIPIRGESAGNHWYEMGHKFVAEHGEELEKTLFIGVPYKLPHMISGWESEGDVLYTTQHDFRAPLACIIDFAIKKLDLKHRGEGRVVRSGIQTYKSGKCIELHRKIPQRDMPTYRLDNHPRVKRTRHSNNLRPQNGADQHVRSDEALGIYATEKRVFTREAVRSSMARMLVIMEFKRWGAVKPESFRAGIDGRPCPEDKHKFGRDAMYHLDQMASYAIVWHTAFVGLCDGESVVLVEFSEDCFHPDIETEKV